MHTKYVILNNGSKGHFLKDSIYSVEEGVLIFNVFLEFNCTLIAEPHIFIHKSFFVSSPQQENILRIFYFQ